MKRKYHYFILAFCVIISCNLVVRLFCSEKDAAISDSLPRVMQIQSGSSNASAEITAVINSGFKLGPLNTITSGNIIISWWLIKPDIPLTTVLSRDLFSGEVNSQAYYTTPGDIILVQTNVDTRLLYDIGGNDVRKYWSLMLE